LEIRATRARGRPAGPRIAVRVDDAIPVRVAPEFDGIDQAGAREFAEGGAHGATIVTRLLG